MIDLPVYLQNTDLWSKGTDSRVHDVNESGKNSKEDLEKVAIEMEALFANQLLKIMRETANNMSTEKKSSEYNTYMGLFDMEMSKLFAERGLGLREAIVNSLDRMQGEIKNANNEIKGEKY